MYPPVSTKDPKAVASEVASAYLQAFPDGNRSFVPEVFHWASECFQGHYQDYLPVDAAYHDFEHTLQGTLCMSRLLAGRRRAGAEPPIGRTHWELGLTAILLHDTGYLKHRNDSEGTGAKYTVTHVRRSAEFAGVLLAEKGFDQKAVQAVKNMIHCTGLESSVESIAFTGEQERLAGHALATSDLLGQMAAEDYVDKLPALFLEFQEAAGHSHGQKHFVSFYDSAEDLMRKTPAFWKDFVQVKLDRDFGGLYRYLNDPFPEGPNDYLDRIEANMSRLRLMFE